MPKRRVPKVIPEGLHPLARYCCLHDLTEGELSSLLGIDRVTLIALENNSYEPTDKQKTKIHLITGLIL